MVTDSGFGDVYITWKRLYLRFQICFHFRGEVYGNNEGGVGQQSPFLIVFKDKYSELDPFWNVRHLGT